MWLIKLGEEKETGNRTIYVYVIIVFKRQCISYHVITKAPKVNC